MFNRGAFRNAGSWLNLSIIGIQFPVCILIGYFWGRSMDGFFGTSPYLMVIFSILGIIAGFRNLFWIVGVAEDLERRQEADEHRDEGNEDTDNGGDAPRT